MKTLVCEFIPFNQAGRNRNAGSPGSAYSYLYTGNREVKVNDWAVVHNDHEFGMTRITRIKPGIDDKVTKHVLTIITQEDFLRYQEANRSINEHRAVFDQLDYLLAEDKKLERYRELAGRSPEAAELLRKAQVWNGPVLEQAMQKPFSFDDKPAATTRSDGAGQASERVTREDVDKARPEDLPYTKTPASDAVTKDDWLRSPFENTHLDPVGDTGEE